MDCPKAQTDVSVIIPSYNSIKTIDYTINGLLKQSKQELIREIIIIDSSDDDVSHEFLKSKQNDIIRVHRSGYRVMPAIQRNIGAKLATGKLLCFIDSDAFPEYNWIESIVDVYDKGTLAGGGSYKIPHFQQSNPIAYAQYFLEFSEFIGFGKPRIKDRFPSCNLFCDRELFVKVGGFPPIRASEDSLFGIETSKYTNMVFFPSIAVCHIFRETPGHFLSNQKLLGKYIYIFRRKAYDSFYLKGFWPYLLIPLFLIFKISRIFVRVLKTNSHNIVYFFLSLPLFLMGTIEWGKGFISGIESYEEESEKIRFGP